jgi:hypothetical protein
VNIRAWGRRLWVLPFLVAVAACTDEEGAPQAATVIVEADSAEPLLLIVSTRFEVISSGEVVFQDIDTIPITGNHSETFQLNSAARFTAILKNDYETVEGARLSVLIDGGLEYDETALLGQGGFLQYVYRFQTNGIF